MTVKTKITSLVVLALCFGLMITSCKKGTPPFADFSASPRSGSAPLTVVFTDQSDPMGDYILSWLWDFGDGFTSVDENPSHVYNDLGQYTVTLIVTNSVGEDSCTKENYINVLQGPLANFRGSPTSGPAPLQVVFEDRSAQGSEPITSWSWTFGDGSTSSERNPTHTYWAPGTYTVSLTVGNLLGSNTQIREDYIEATGP
jgi:PKD repeat protein